MSLNRFFRRFSQSAFRTSIALTLSLIAVALFVRAGRTAGNPQSPISNPQSVAPAVPIQPGQALPVALNNHTGTLLLDGRVLVAGGTTNGQSANAQRAAYLYDPATGQWASTGALNTARMGHFAVMLQSGRVLVAGGIDGGGTVLRSAELYDPVTGQWTSTGAMASARYGGTGTLVSFASNIPNAPDGSVVAVGGNAGGGPVNTVELYNPLTGTWRARANLRTARFLHGAVVLPDGTLLVAGGSGGGSNFLASVERYDPVADRWNLERPLSAARENPTATLLTNGLALIAGGRNSGGRLSATEIYDPVGRAWSAGPAMLNARERHTASLLPNGRLLVAGGIGTSGVAINSAETYDSSARRWDAAFTLGEARAVHVAVILANARVLFIGGTNTQTEATALSSVDIHDPAVGFWTTQSGPNVKRFGHTATLLPNGRVLIVGGRIDDFRVTASTEIYDPASGNWTAAGDLNTARECHTATLLNNGSVLVTGGLGGGLLNTAELYDPSTGQWRFTSTNLVRPRALHTATLLPDGRVLAAGGQATSGSEATAEIYDPRSDSWAAAAQMRAARYGHTATLLFDGRVLLAGGFPALGSTTSQTTSELYTPGSNSWAFTSSPMAIGRYGHTATLLPNGRVLVVSGFRGSNLQVPSNAAGSAEIFNPVNQSWATTTPPDGRIAHTATLLPNGQVLIVGGFKLNGPTTNVELYDPARGVSVPFETLSNAQLVTARDLHTATLLPNGRVLIVGGENDDGVPVTTNELFDVGLRTAQLVEPGIAEALWRGPGTSVCLVGIRFQGIGEAASGNFQGSAGNYPVVQLRRLDNEQTINLLPDFSATGCNATRGWTNNGYVSRNVAATTATLGGVGNLHPGAALITVFVNGVPNTRSVVIAPPGAVIGGTPVVSVQGRIFTIDDAGFPATVELRSPSGQLIATRDTNTNGEYIFEDVPDPTVSPTPTPTVGIVRGTVLNAATGQALASATVTVSGTNLSATSTSNGTYTLNNVLAGQRTLTAAAAGFNSSQAVVSVAANQTVTQDFRLSPVATTGTITGTVVNASTGGAIAGATIVVAGTSLSATTSSNGAFTLTNVPAGTQTLTVSASGFTTIQGTVPVVAGQTINLTPIQLQPVATTGTVTGTVRSTATTGPVIVGATATIAGTNISATTNSAGVYTLSNVLAGARTLTVSANGFTTGQFSITVTAGQTLPANVVLQPAATSGTITGTVRNAQTGAGLAGATVSTTGAAGTVISVITNSAGTYTLSNLPPGTRTVSASASGFVSSSVSATVVAGQTLTVNLSLSPTTPTGQIRITLNWVKDANQRPDDLDAHMFGPLGDGVCFEVFFGNTGSLTTSPFAQLEVDNIGLAGHPPTETIRVAQTRAGTYRFFVHDFRSELDGFGISTSRATVQVFDNNVLRATFVAPTGGGDYWHVFDMNGTTRAITNINRLQGTEPFTPCSSFAPLAGADVTAAKMKPKSEPVGPPAPIEVSDVVWLPVVPEEPADSSAQQQQGNYTITPRGRSANGNTVIFVPPVVPIIFPVGFTGGPPGARGLRIPTAGSNGDSCAQTTPNNQIGGQLTALSSGTGVTVRMTITNQRADCKLPATVNATIAVAGPALNFSQTGLALYGDYLIEPMSSTHTFSAGGLTTRAVARLDGPALGLDFASIPNVTCPPAVSAAVNGQASAQLCAGQPINLTAEFLLGASYTWSGPNGYSSNQQNPPAFTAMALTAGTYTVTATIPNCPTRMASVNVAVNSFNVTPGNLNFGAEGGSATANVAATVNSCPWTATSSVDWLTFNAGGGTGNGAVTYTVAANNSPNQRSGTITIAGQNFTVTQASLNCTYSIAPTSANVAATASTGSVSITAPNGCAWTATSNADWLTFSGNTSGNGNGSVNYNVAANNGPQRTGTMTIAGQTFTVTQANGCTFTINPASQNFNADAGSGTVNVSTANGCTWTATSNADWLTITSGASGNGPGATNFNVAANTTANQRTGTLTVAGNTFSVTQAGVACTYAIAPTSANVAATASNGTVNITAPNGCAWTATSNADWLTFSGNTSGSGNGAVNYNVAANNGPQRIGTLTVAGQTFTVTQAGGCTFTINPTSQNFGAAASTGLVNVTTANGCTWTATSNVDWLTITSGASGNGNGAVNYSVAANTAANQRTGTLTVAGNTFTVTQDGVSCTYAIAPTNANQPAGGGSGTVNVTAPNGCAWTATSNAPWLTFNGATSGNGNGAVNYSAAANTGTQRTGTLTVAGQTFTVTQDSGCALTITTASLPNATLNAAYAQTLAAANGNGAVTWSVSVGALPAGLQINPTTGAITGTPAALGSATFTIRAADAAGCTTTREFTITVVCPTITINPPSLPNATAAQSYEVILSQTGGSGAIAWSVSFGALPNGLSLNPTTGVISGTPTAAGMASFTIRAVDANNCPGTRDYSLTINPPVCPPTVTITPATLASGTVNANYNVALSQTGLSGTLTWSISNGALPAGLQINPATGAITGTPTAPGTTNFTVRVIDANNCAGTRDYSLTINCQAITINPASLPNGTVGANYSNTPTQSGASGATTWSVSAGALPAGLQLNPSTGAITGAPTAVGTSNFTLRVVDANNCPGTRDYSITVGCQTITISQTALPNATLGSGYNTTLTQTGAIGAVTWSVSVGALPVGLQLNPTTGAITGTPTALGAATFTIRTTDANGCTGTQSLTLTVVCAMITINPSSLPNATAGQSYEALLSQTGGGGTIAWSVSFGALPANLTLNAATGVISGTPAAMGTAAFTIRATDANGCFGTRDYSLTINAPLCPPAVTITPPTLANGTVGANYSVALAQAGLSGTTMWSISGGALPSGLQINPATGAITGTPTAPGTSNFTVRVADANNCAGTRDYSLTINCQTITINQTFLPGATLGTGYSTTLTQMGASGAVTWSVSAGALPAGLLLNAATGVISGTPAAAGSASFTIRATDANNCFGTRDYSLTINPPLCPPAVTINPPTLPGGTVGAAYSALLSQTGLSGTLTWSVSAGALPAGLQINSMTGAITGTPTTAGASNFTVRVADANNCAGTRDYTLTIGPSNCPPMVTINPPSLPNAAINAEYTILFSQAGLSEPLIWSVSAGALPAGLSLNPVTGVLTGASTALGTANFTIRVAAANGCFGTREHTLVTQQSHSVPAVSALTPTTVSAGGQGLMLTINGSGFSTAARVRWNGGDRPTTLVSATQLQAQIPASDLALPGVVQVTVFNPPPGGGASPPMTFTIIGALSTVSAASFFGNELAAESIIAAFGVGLATGLEVATTVPLPTELRGTRVRVRDSAGTERFAPLFFVSAGQINFQLPPGTTLGAATVTVTSGDNRTSVGPTTVVNVAPGLLAANANGLGVAAATVFRLRADGSQSFEEVARFDAAQQRFVSMPIDLGPATDQTFLLLFGLGFRFRTALPAVTCRIGGVDAEVSFAGRQPDFIGLDQANVRIPRSLAGRGEVDVVLTVDGKVANVVRINVR